MAADEAHYQSQYPGAKSRKNKRDAEIIGDRTQCSREPGVLIITGLDGGPPEAACDRCRCEAYRHIDQTQTWETCHVAALRSADVWAALASGAAHC